jgi:hypothetical protein
VIEDKVREEFREGRPLTEILDEYEILRISGLKIIEAREDQVSSTLR